MRKRLSDVRCCNMWNWAESDTNVTQFRAAWPLSLLPQTCQFSSSINPFPPTVIFLLLLPVSVPTTTSYLIVVTPATTSYLIVVTPASSTTTSPRLCRDPTPRHPHLGQPRHPHPQLLLQQYRFLLQPTPTTTTHPRLCRDSTLRHPHL